MTSRSWILVVLVLAGVAASPASGRSFCRATPVRGDLVRAGPFTGGLDADFDVVRGRFALHVGPWRIKGVLSQKIPWFVAAGAHVSPVLSVTGIRLDPRPAARFTQTFGVARSGNVFPSDLAPPSPGCWRLALRSGSAHGALVVLVRR